MAGFRFARTQGQEGSSGNLREFAIAPGNTTKIYAGDLVTLNAGNVQVSNGAAAADILGIFAGCKFVDVDGSVKYSRYWDGAAGRSEIRAMISVVPAGSTLLVKGLAGSNYTQADIGTRKPAATGVAGNDATGDSGQTLGAAGATVANAPLVVLAEIDMADGNRWFEVAIHTDNAIIAGGL